MGVITGFGGLEINTSSTALQALTDAVIYITNYQYASSEALASRILTIAALRDVLTAFEADGLPSVVEMETAVLRDIESLQGMQKLGWRLPLLGTGSGLSSIQHHSCGTCVGDGTTKRVRCSN